MNGGSRVLLETRIAFRACATVRVYSLDVVSSTRRTICAIATRLVRHEVVRCEADAASLNLYWSGECGEATRRFLLDDLAEAIIARRCRDHNLYVEAPTGNPGERAVLEVQVHHTLHSRLKMVLLIEQSGDEDEAFDTAIRKMLEGKIADVHVDGDTQRHIS